MTITIPVAVARAVIASAWAEKHPANADDPQGRAHKRYKAAAMSVSSRKLYSYNAKMLREWLEPVRVSVDEMMNNGIPTAKIAPVLDFANVLNRELTRLEREEAQQVEREKEQAAHRQVEYRRNSTRRRQRTMSGLIEAGRMQVLNDICQDYGLDRKDPGVMAGLVAAYHAGVFRYREVIESVSHVDPDPVSTQDLDKLIERDRVMFARVEETKP